MAAGAYPFLAEVPPKMFVRALAATELAVGAALLAPTVSNGIAGLALTGFSGALLMMYLRTSSLHQPGSVWPTPAGIGISKDSWMFASAWGCSPTPPSTVAEATGLAGR
jgi:hypothetical protein